MMKRLTILMLLLVSTNVLAECTRIGESDDGDLTSYVDLHTIRKRGNKTKMWSLLSFKTSRRLEISGRAYSSDRSISEYDCSDATFSTLTRCSTFKNQI